MKHLLVMLPLMTAAAALASCTATERGAAIGGAGGAIVGGAVTAMWVVQLSVAPSGLLPAP